MRLRAFAVSLVALAGLSACATDGRTPIVVYSPHGRDQLTLLEHSFEALHPTYDVRWLDMGSQEILDRLRFERVNPQADVWFGGPSVLFDRGVQDSLIRPIRPVWADAVGPRGIQRDGMYWPVYRTPAVIAYNSQAVTAAEAPKDWDDVLAPRWADQVLIRDPVASGTMRAIWGLVLVKSIRATGDTAEGMAWLRKLDAQTRAYTLNPAILDEKLARREGTVTLWDLPDILLSQRKGLPFGYVFPASGTVVIEDVIALVRGAPNAAGAQLYIDHVGSLEAQAACAREVYRLPARHDLPPDQVPAWVTQVERDMVEFDMDWPMLAEQGSAWMGYWDQHVRNTGRKAEAARGN